MSKILRYFIQFDEMAQKHNYLTGALFMASMMGNMLDAGIIYSIIIAVAGTVALFAVWRE